MTLNGFPSLLDLSIFGQVNGAKGAERILFPSDAEKIKSCQRRYKPPRTLAIQRLLQRALKLKNHLDNTPGLTRVALANSLGIDPSRITQILNLLNLVPQIQAYIGDLQATKHYRQIGDREWMKLARIQDHLLQIDEFERLRNPMHANTCS